MLLTVGIAILSATAGVGITYYWIKTVVVKNSTI